MTQQVCWYRIDRYKRTDRNHLMKDAPQLISEIIKVAVIEDQPVIRYGLRVLLDSTDGYRCTGCFNSVEAALPKLAEDRPDIILMDIGLPGMTGIDGIKIVRQRWPDTL